MECQLVAAQDNLNRACMELSGRDILAVDTEFVRVSTYYPRLCLIQIAARDCIYCFDMLAPEVSYRSLWALLGCERPVKVMHAARQDIEAMLHTSGTIPNNVFDTQIAATLSGHGDQVGYARLVAEVFGTSLGKAAQRTDWSRRPLSREQIEYAGDDVRYLIPLYDELGKQLRSLGREQWVVEDCARLRQRELYEVAPEEAYRRVGKGAHISPEAQHRLRRLCTWRENEAQKRDLPRHWVAVDDALVALALAAPRDVSELAALPGVSQKVARRYGETLVRMISEPVEDKHPLWKKVERLNRTEIALKSSLLAALRDIAGALNIPESALASRSDLDRLVRGSKEVNVARGWRRSVAGNTLLNLMEQQES